MSLSLTVAIITQNEEKMLEACLQSVAPLQARLLIIDSASTDKTRDIAQTFQAQIHVFSDWQGFGAQRNRAHEFLQTDWVLWLDADERLNPAICQEIIQALSQTPADGKTLFAINRLSTAYGKAIYHGGWFPDNVVRLYPPQHTRYNDNLVHESVIVPKDAQTIVFKTPVEHITYTDLTQQLRKTQQYALAWATQNQGRKAHPAIAFVRAIFAFLKMYLLKRGFLDGAHGLVLAIMNAIYTFIKYTQLWVFNQTVNQKKNRQ